MTITSEKKSPRIHSQMTIEEILSSFSHCSHQLSEAITQEGLHCVGCHAATWETLEEGMQGHGMTRESIDQLVHKLNQIVEKAPLMPQEVSKNVSLTPGAAAQIKQILQEENKVHWMLRFGDKRSGCSGYEYTLEFAEKSEPDDVVMSSEGIKIVIKQSMLPRLMGTVIGYRDDSGHSGFSIDNPNTKGGCGCGSSHSY